MLKFVKEKELTANLYLDNHKNLKDRYHLIKVIKMYLEKFNVQIFKYRNN